MNKNTFIRIRMAQQQKQRQQAAQSAPPPPPFVQEQPPDDSYISQKGYTIYKKNLTVKQLEYLKKECTKIPVVQGVAARLSGKQEGIPIYRENDAKIYLPRYFGIRLFGYPNRMDIPVGEKINIEFKADKLFPHQIETIDKFMGAVAAAQEKPCGGILELPCGFGKTVIALKIISLLSRKTIILVHKEFLMNQWIERIEQFLPSARIGRIQGKIFDIENKDIVLGMIQTIYNRDFSDKNGDFSGKNVVSFSDKNGDFSGKNVVSGTLNSFGFVVVDEVHRIGSQEFSNTLTKISPFYTLGISATVERKDGLTSIIYDFLGDTIHRVVRDKKEVVNVRAVKFDVPETEASYHELEYDKTGNIAYSRMVSKIANYKPRNDFIIELLNNTMRENRHQQIIVLGHLRAQLVYLYEILKKQGKYEVGYYLGGMKQIQLEESESCQIILATYAMAAEALDIKSLTTLVFITPKTDIVQSVGRILRAAHTECDPLIIDIRDEHSCFKNQWLKRKQYYVSCNYNVTKM